ncbi:MAG: tetratricopeptide repeat protein [Candidatus Saganbacteria bacterium]|nr:tetratricopeptide repeat protein [Candidatus Saganbacteria bacterium]
MRIIVCFLIIIVMASASFSGPLNGHKRAESYFAQGYLYYIEGSYNEAIPEFVKALKFYPAMAKSRYWMAKTYYQQGLYKNTVNQCNAALSIIPNYTNARSLKARAQKKLETKKVSPVHAAKAAPKSLSRSLISLDLRNVDISSVLQIFSKETGISILAGRDVYGKKRARKSGRTPRRSICKDFHH